MVKIELERNENNIIVSVIFKNDGFASGFGENIKSAIKDIPFESIERDYKYSKEQVMKFINQFIK
jgi:hypothetical protein